VPQAVVAFRNALANGFTALRAVMDGTDHEAGLPGAGGQGDEGDQSAMAAIS